MIGRNLSLLETNAPTPDEIMLQKLLSTPVMDSNTQAAPWSGLFRQIQTYAAQYRARTRKPVRFWRELAAFSLLLMSLTWTVPWFRSLTQATQAISSHQTFGIFLVLGLAAYYVMRFLNVFQVRPAVRRQTLFGVLLIGIFLSLKTILYAKEVVPLTELVMRPLWAFGNFSALIPNEIIVVIAVMLVWRRGMVLSIDYIGPERARSEFKLGFWLFLAFMVLNTLVTKEAIDFDYLGGYVLFGLIAMGGARMSAVGELRGGGKSVFDIQRFAAVMLGAFLTAAVAYWVGFNFGKDGAILASFVVGVAITASFLVSAPVLLIVLYLLYALIRYFENDIAGLMTRMVNAIEGLMMVIDALKTWIQDMGVFLADKLIFLAPLFRWLFSLAPLVRTFLLITSVLLAGGLILLALYIREKRLRALDGDDHAGSLDLEDMWLLFRRRLTQKLADQMNVVSTALDLKNRYRKSLAKHIRTMYVDFLEMSEEMGHPKLAAQTPREFQAFLEKYFPGEIDHLGVITDAYLKVRYGELPEEQAEVAAVHTALKNLRKAGNRMQGKKWTR